ncbi:MAG: HEAT repeat domain-containing protein [Planctomycetaceae bacterium]
MNISDELNGSFSDNAESLPDNLPPVEPPTAGFIVQLFVVPALIVMAVVGVWLLFGQMASSDQDLSQVIVDLKSDNVHRQWRAAFSLAQILEADAQRGDQGQHLAQSVPLATDLSKLLQSQLKITTPTPEDLQKQSYLIRSLGWFDLPEVVFPALAEAIRGEVTAPEGTPERELQAELKQSALTSIAQIAGRAQEQNQPLSNAAIVEGIGEMAGDPDPRLRRMAAFTLSLFSGTAAIDRLEAMLIDADEMTRLNAAVGLTRNGSAAGFNVLKKYLQASASQRLMTETESSASSASLTEQEQNEQKIAEFEQGVALKNVVKAMGSLSSQLSEPERNEMIGLIEPIAENHRLPEIRQTAMESLEQLRAG